MKPSGPYLGFRPLLVMRSSTRGDPAFPVLLFLHDFRRPVSTTRSPENSHPYVESFRGSAHAELNDTTETEHNLAAKKKAGMVGHSQIQC